jgi:hypothetical protein
MFLGYWRLKGLLSKLSQRVDEGFSKHIRTYIMIILRFNVTRL